MERQRYEVTLRTGSKDSVMWTNRLCELTPVLELALSGMQTTQPVALAVRDTATGGRAEVSAATCIGFWEACRKALAAVEQCEPRRVRAGSGRDVVVEVRFAAHYATLEQCKEFVRACMDQSVRDQAPEYDGAPEISYNGEVVGEAWFES